MKNFSIILTFTIVIFTFGNEISMACHEESMGGNGGIWPTLRGHNPSTRSNGLLIFTESTTAVSSTTTSCDAYTAFLEKNYYQIAETIARGNGVFIDAIISYYGCTEENLQRIEILLHRNYSQIFKNSSKNGNILGFRLESILKSDLKLSRECYFLS